MILKNGYETDSCGVIRHYVDGDLHSINDEPAVTCLNGNKYWMNCNIIHRDGGPALIEHKPDGISELWYKNGLVHREDGPAAIHSHAKLWFIDGIQHRADGPAVEHTDGGKAWFFKGRLHREDGPAVESIEGVRTWYKHGKLHRLDGPADENIHCHITWWIDGVEMKVKNQREFARLVKLKAFW